jgi:cysteine-rich repeat protein
MRRVITITAVSAGLIFAAAAQAVELSDISASPYAEAIRELSDRSIVKGYSDGTFRPDSQVNRAEFLKILTGTRFPDAPTPQDLMCFKDLEVKTPQWYAYPVCLAAALGIVNGYPDGNFRPEQTVNLAEALKMSFRSFGITVTNSGSQWFEPYLVSARNRDILVPLLRKPDHLLTRGEMAELTYVLFKEYAKNTGKTGSGAAMCGNGILDPGEQCDDGNTADGDGCSSICLIVPEPIRLGLLEIDQQAAGTRTTIAQGQQDLPLLKFTALSGRQDVILTSLKFKPSEGSLAFAQNYRLLMDRNGDGKYETVVKTSGRADANSLIFDNFDNGALLLPNGVPVPFMLTADLAVNLGPVSIGLQFDTDTPDYIEAQGARDGLALTGIETDNICTANNCFIRVNTESSANIDVLERGNLFITEDTTPTRNHILLGGAISPALLRLRLRSDGEDIDVRTLNFDGLVSSVESLRLYTISPGGTFDPKTTEPLAVATNGQCTGQPATRFCANFSLGMLVVRPDQEVVLVVTAKLKDKSLGAVSGEAMSISLSASTDQSAKAAEARGISSQETLLMNNGDAREDGELFIGTAVPAPNHQITAKTSDTALAGIQQIVNYGPADDLYIPSGQNTIGAFRIYAYPHTNNYQGSNDVVLKTITFNVTAQNVRLDPLGFSLRTPDDPALFAPCTATDSTGQITVTCSQLDLQTLPNHIEQGTYKRYLLQANVTSPEITPGSATLTVPLPTFGQRSAQNSVSWSDGSTSFNWVDLPVNSVDSTVYRQR